LRLRLCFAAHDMGIDENGWKRDLYAAHYPNGFEVVWVEKPREHEGLMAAYALNQEKAKAVVEPTPKEEARD